jgi:hypothetical protein
VGVCDTVRSHPVALGPILYASRTPLALTRAPGQDIILAVNGREIRLEIASVDGSQVRVAITAPDDVAI